VRRSPQKEAKEESRHARDPARKRTEACPAPPTEAPQPTPICWSARRRVRSPRPEFEEQRPMSKESEEIGVSREVEKESRRREQQAL